MHLHAVFGDGEPETRAALGLGEGTVELLKPIVASLASQRRTALVAICAQAGCRTLDEREITRKIAAVAVCSCRGSASSRLSSSTDRSLRSVGTSEGIPASNPSHAQRIAEAKLDAILREAMIRRNMHFLHQAERMNEPNVLLRFCCLDTPIPDRAMAHIWRSDGATWFHPKHVTPEFAAGVATQQK